MTQDGEWAAPLLWRSEFRNTLAGCMRRSTLSFEQAREPQAEAEALLAGNEHEIDSVRVLKLVRDSDCSACDCEFMALATHLKTALVTLDAKLLKVFPRRAVSLPAG